jgi:hypothetical protein
MREHLSATHGTDRKKNPTLKGSHLRDGGATLSGSERFTFAYRGRRSLSFAAAPGYYLYPLRGL